MYKKITIMHTEPVSIVMLTHEQAWCLGLAATIDSCVGAAPMERLDSYTFNSYAAGQAWGFSLRQAPATYTADAGVM